MPRWTEEARKAQSERMMKTQAWLKATGPNTQEGKKKASQNAVKHGLRSELAGELRKVLREQAKILKDLD